MHPYTGRSAGVARQQEPSPDSHDNDKRQPANGRSEIAYSRSFRRTGKMTTCEVRLPGEPCRFNLVKSFRHVVPSPEAATKPGVLHCTAMEPHGRYTARPQSRLPTARFRRWIFNPRIRKWLHRKPTIIGRWGRGCAKGIAMPNPGR